MTAKRKYTWTKGCIPPHERIMARVDTSDPDACWIWPGAKRKGYGCVTVGSRTDGTRRLRQTHIVVYEALVGLVPEDLELDHLCRARACFNPLHLDPVPHVLNMQRMPEEYMSILRERLAEARELRWAA